MTSNRLAAALAALMVLASRSAVAQSGEPASADDETGDGGGQELLARQDEDPSAEVRELAKIDQTVQSGDVEKQKLHKEGGETVAPASPLTPVIPEPEKPPNRAYQLYWQVDLPVFAFSLVLGLGRMVRRSESAAPPYCTTLPEGCDKDELSVIDRPFAGRYSPEWGFVSDIGLYTLAAVPVPLLTLDEGFGNAVNDAIVIYESTLLATALGGLATLSANRARPFVYGDEAPLEKRTSPDAALSFISGHTTAAFALSTSLFWTFERRHGLDWVSGTVLAAGTLTSGFVSISRVAAGKHFPSDVMAGMVVGASVGTLIPFLHETPVTVVPDATEDHATVNVLGRF